MTPDRPTRREIARFWTHRPNRKEIQLPHPPRPPLTSAAGTEELPLPHAHPED